MQASPGQNSGNAAAAQPLAHRASPGRFRAACSRHTGHAGNLRTADRGSRWLPQRVVRAAMQSQRQGTYWLGARALGFAADPALVIAPGQATESIPLAPRAAGTTLFFEALDGLAGGITIGRAHATPILLSGSRSMLTMPRRAKSLPHAQFTHLILLSSNPKACAIPSR